MPSQRDWMPLRYAGATFAGYQAVTESAGRAKAAAERFARGEIGGLAITGKVGTGKTHLAVAAARGRFDWEADTWTTANPAPEFETWNDRTRREGTAPVIPRWCSVPELIVGLRADIDRDREERRWGGELDRLAAHRGVVILDDLGREKVSDWTGESIYALVNGRYERMLPTIITTNVTGAELAASPYWPVISRIAEDGELRIIEAPDYRTAAAKARRTA